ncbi:hypothetical protein C922_01440 [Plasmodium inui San Antonio 1]|uniref:RNA-editing substrate-binding complex 6 protein domain-containing protein n=1 Tax=Plasmodium inui San Antonio 1 TaxID=1237626 RepID=W7A5J3_9APIC|nr:hypothetical protein C922_01440 [Plasmodium inui San Antonio 1]EUD68417.1 hypothetical protein C922_01440 [Plasmodium inui San Antonio 1]
MSVASLFRSPLKGKLLNKVKNNKGYLPYRTVTKRFGELHQPRTKSEKKSHLEMIDEVYFDMADAMREKNKLEMEEFSSLHRNISEIILNHNTSKKNEVVKNIMRYCIELSRSSKTDDQRNKKEKKKGGDTTKVQIMEEGAEEVEKEVEEEEKKKDVLNIIKCNIKDHSSQFNSCEIGIILKCLLKIKVNDPYLVNTLLQHYFRRNMKFSQYGSLYVLYAFAKLKLLPEQENKFKLLCADIVKKIDNFEFKNLCLICNYLSALYNFNRFYIRNVVEQICSYLIGKSSHKEHPHEGHAGVYPDSVWCPDSIHYVANACARVNHLNKELFQFLKDKIEEKAAYFSIDQLVSLTNAYSKFKSAEEANFLTLYIRIAEELINKSYLLKPRHLSVLANSFNNACVLHEELFHIITQNSLLLLSSFEPKQIVMIIHAYVNIGLSNNALLESIWNTAAVFIHEYTLQELSMLLQAYTKSSQHRQDFFHQLSSKIYLLLTTSYPFLEQNGTVNSVTYTDQKYVEMIGKAKGFDNLTPERITSEKLFSILYLLFNHQYYCSYVDNLSTKHGAKHDCRLHSGEHIQIGSPPKGPPTRNEFNSNKHLNSFSGYTLNDPKNASYTFLTRTVGMEELPQTTHCSGHYSETSPLITTLSGKTKQQKSVDPNEDPNPDRGNTQVKDLHENLSPSVNNPPSEVPQINYSNSSNNHSLDTDKMEQLLITHLSKDINSTLVCSIIYSLIKGNCLLQYDLLICLCKLAFIFVKQFKTSELANVCSALSEAYVRASDENNRQNELIAKWQNGRDSEETADEGAASSQTVSTSSLRSPHEKNKTEKNGPTYDEQLYNSSKQYLIMCTLFFDNVQSHLGKKKSSFTDVHSTYKLITAFGGLRMSKYSSISLHLFRLSLLEIKNLSYLPLQKMANAFMEMNVYNEDVYAFINKIQKTKKNK